MFESCVCGSSPRHHQRPQRWSSSSLKGLKTSLGRPKPYVPMMVLEGVVSIGLCLG